MPQVRPVTTPAELLELQGDWERLLTHAPAANVFLTFDWLSTWWRHYGGARRLCVLAAYEGKELTGLAPLMIEERRLLGLPVFRRIAFLGTGISDRLDMLLTPGVGGATLEAIIAHLVRQRWDMLDLQEVPEESVTAKLLPELAEPLGVRVEVTPQSVCPVVKLARDSEKHLAGLGKKLRQNLTYYGRRLRKEHEVGIHFVQGGPCLSENLQAFFRLYRKALADRPGARNLLGPTFSAFRKEVALRFAERDRFLLTLLRIDGVVAAGGLCFPYCGTCYEYNLCYDPAWKGGRLGTILQWEVIRHAIALGCHEYDCLRGDEAYKYQWGAQPRRHVRIRISRPTPKLHLLQVGLRLARSRPGFKVAEWVRNRLPVGHG